MNMGLEHLPSELQIEVFRYLDNTDLKAARATSRKSRDNASPMLFRSVIACARYLALGAFQKISVHSVLSRYVKEIVFDGSLYDAIYATSQDAYCTKNDELSDLRMSSFWGKRTRWKRYQELYKDQEDMKVTGVLLQTISRALDWTANLSSIVYSPHPRLVPIEKVEVRDLLPRGLSRRSLQGNRVSSQPNSSGHPFRHLVGAIYISEYSGVRELRVERCKAGLPGTEFTQAIFDFPDIADFEAAKYLFQRLETCELNVEGSWRPRIPENQNVANMRALLLSAPDLHHLALHLTEWHVRSDSMPSYFPDDSEPIFGSIGLRNTWTKLRSLSLERIEGTETDFTGLVARHRNTMTSLTLHKCSLITGRWCEVVDEVVYTTRILPFSLKCVNEIDIRDIPDTEDLAYYVTHMNQWWYEGHITVSAMGERSFVDSNADKRSVYYWRQKQT